MYLDSCVCCSSSTESAQIMTESIKSDMISSGFVPKVEKVVGYQCSDFNGGLYHIYT